MREKDLDKERKIREFLDREFGEDINIEDYQIINNINSKQNKEDYDILLKKAKMFDRIISILSEDYVIRRKSDIIESSDVYDW